MPIYIHAYALNLSVDTRTHFMCLEKPKSKFSDADNYLMWYAYLIKIRSRNLFSYVLGGCLQTMVGPRVIMQRDDSGRTRRRRSLSCACDAVRATADTAQRKRSGIWSDHWHCSLPKATMLILPIS